MPDVFISYKRMERARVRRLADALTQLKIDVWFDAELDPGGAFFSKIQHALDASRAVIVCWTPEATESAYVLGEAEHGRTQKKIVPVFFAPCTLPSPFNMIHAEDLSAWAGDIRDASSSWRKVVGELSRLLQRPGLLQFLDLSTAQDAAALRRWSSDNWKDPLATEAVELARRLEAGESPFPQTRAPIDDEIARLGARAAEAAQNDDGGQALVNLGRDYLEGFGAPQDEEAARVLFMAAANKGNGYAYFNLGQMFVQGRGVVADHPRARQYFEKAASKGVAEALTSLGKMAEDGLAGARDYAKARALYEKGAAGGDAMALANLGVLHGAGRGVPQNWSEARKFFEQAAQMGNASALDNLGTIYARGLGVAPNPEFARQCYESAAQRGDRSAIYNLGVMHLEGAAGERDLTAARDCFDRASRLGHAAATANLAAMYANGIGAEPDVDRAIELFERAAALRAPTAFVNLGRIYSDTSHHKFNPERARECFRQACDIGDEEGCLHLADMLASGEGGPQDTHEAARILNRLAKQTSHPQVQEMARAILAQLR